MKLYSVHEVTHFEKVLRMSEVMLAEELQECINTWPKSYGIYTELRVYDVQACKYIDINDINQ